MTTRTPGHRHTGFTLVEMLLAITLISLLLGLAYGGMRAATRSSESGQVLLEQTSRLRITHQFVRKQLNLMLPLAFALDEDQEDARTVFLGDPERIVFVGPMPGYLGNGGPQVQVMELADGEDGLRLQFRHALLQGFEPERLFDRDPVVLLDGLRDVRFQFLETDDEGEVTGWVEGWEQVDITPLAVRLDIEFGPDARVEWPPLIASVRLDALAVGVGGLNRDYGDAIQDLIRKRGEQQ